VRRNKKSFHAADTRDLTVPPGLFFISSPHDSGQTLCGLHDSVPVPQPTGSRDLCGRIFTVKPEPENRRTIKDQYQQDKPGRFVPIVLGPDHESLEKKAQAECDQDGGEHDPRCEPAAKKASHCNEIIPVH
jgi:hypothetical protein